MKKKGMFWLKAELTGASAAEILNRLASAGVGFRGAETGEKGLVVTLGLRFLPRLQAVCREEGLQLRVLRRGLGAGACFRLRHRLLLLGLLLPLLALVWFSSLYVWEIRVVGNRRVTSGEILRHLEELGVGVGSFRPGIDHARVSGEMLLRIPELSFLSCNSFGSRMVVSVREESPTPDPESDASGQDLVAGREGILHSLTVLSGEALVRPGQLVEPGQLLVRSRRVDLQGESREEGALALAEAWTHYELRAVTPLLALEKTAYGEPERDLSLYLFGKHINFLGMYGNPPLYCDKITVVRSLTLPGGAVLPFALGETLVLPARAEERALDPEAARRYLETRLREGLEARIQGRIVSQSTLAEERDGMLVVTFRAVCLENIAVTGENTDTE